MLTFENDTQAEKLEIHSDLDGLKHLHQLLGDLIEQSQTKGSNHLHLMTESWGGSGLTDHLQGEGNILFNHVKIFCWIK